MHADAESLREMADWLGTDAARAALGRSTKRALKLAGLREGLRRAGLQQLANQSDDDLAETFGAALMVRRRQTAVSELAMWARFAEDHRRTVDEARAEALGALRFLDVMLEPSRFISIPRAEEIRAQIGPLIESLKSCAPSCRSLPTVERMLDAQLARMSDEDGMDFDADEFDLEKVEADVERLRDEMRPKRGRPKADDIDENIVEKLADLGATKSEALDALKLSRNTLSERRARQRKG